MKIFARVILAVVCFVLAVPTLVLASDSDPASFTASVTPSPVHPGEVAEVDLKAVIDPGWHLYGLVPVPPPGPSATSIAVSGPNEQSAGDVSENPPIQAFDKNFSKNVTYHLAHADFTVPVKVASSCPAGTDNVTLTVNYQTCNDSFCLPPRTKTITLPVQVILGGVRSQYSTSHIPSKSDGSLLLFLAAAIGAGLLSLITPCVFPLIPITFSSFIKQADGNKRKLVQLSVGYSAGIVALYVAVGALTTLFLGASGISRLATNPWVNLFAFAVFMIFALSFFETIRIEVPANLGALQTAAKKQTGWVGLAALGIVFVLASFTCTAPFIGTLLVTAAGGSLTRPLLGMSVFSLAFVSPFLLFSVFPNWVTKIPKSGIWLARVKATLGFIEIAAALKFLSNADLVWQWKVLTQPVLLAAWAVIFLLTALYLFGLLQFGIVAETEVRGTKITPMRGGFGILFVLISLYCFWGLSGRPINPYIAAYLPPNGYGAGETDGLPGVPWLSSYDSALATARSQGKPLLIDFTGYTCTNCRLNEKQVFPDAAVQAKFADFVRVQLYTDGGADAQSNENLEVTKFGSAALPLYGIIDPATGSVLAKTAGVQSISGFETFLNSAQTASSPANAEWTAYSDSALASSAAQQKPAIVDFTANWCTNCKAIEKTVFTDPQVSSKLQSFDTYRCDMTNYYSAPNTALQRKYKILALPAIVFLDKTGNEVPNTRVTGLISVQDFLKRIGLASNG